MARAWDAAQTRLMTATEAELDQWIAGEWKNPTNGYLLPRLVTRRAEVRKKREIAATHARLAKVLHR